MKKVTEVRSPGLGTIYDESELEAIRQIMRECIGTNRSISMGSPEIEAF